MALSLKFALNLHWLLGLVSHVLFILVEEVWQLIKCMSWKTKIYTSWHLFLLFLVMWLIIGWINYIFMCAPFLIHFMWIVYILYVFVIHSCEEKKCVPHFKEYWSILMLYRVSIFILHIFFIKYADRKCVTYNLVQGSKLLSQNTCVFN